MKAPPSNLKLHYPAELPVSGRREEILAAVKHHPVVIVCGDTGSGKTTQLPKMMLEAVGEAPGRIGITQPRRLAATSMAARVAEECGVELGEEVGVQVRFMNRTSPRTRIQFMTDGLLLAQLPRDRAWSGYAAFIIDEAHERSLNIDFILGCLKNLLPSRPDLKIIISSATLDAERFSAFFGGAPVLQVEGRLYPIADEDLPPDPERDLALPDRVLEAVEHLDRQHGDLDTLVFLPGEREIKDCTRKLAGRYTHRAEILPLFARLGAGEQQKVFKGSERRRIILATNVAETSLTIPGIRAVIDTGQVRMQRFHPQSGIQRLLTEQVSKASARQRRGRCGRTGPGVCLRLYSPEDLEKAGDYQDPEIRRSSLAEVILRMAVMQLPPIQKFPFIDPPKGAAVSEGYRTLFDIGAMTGKRELTRRGRLLAGFNLEPRLARMLEEGHQEQVLPAVIVCAAFLSIQDPRERPAEKTEAADSAHARWQDPDSDFLGILSLWTDICRSSASRSKRNRYCRDHFLHPRRVEEWMNLVDDLRETCHKHHWQVPASIGEMELLDTDGLHRSLLAGIPRSVGEREENQQFRTPGGQLFRVFPSSALSKKPPRWVMAFTLMETSRLFARECALLNPDWVEEVAGHLCSYQYERPVWNPKRGFVEAEERARLGQLTLRSGKRIHYGRIDPAAAREIFIRDALVPANLQVRGPSFKTYLKLRRSLDRWEQKLRVPGSFLNTTVFEDYFNRLLPSSLCTQKDFQRWAEHNRWVPTLSDILDEEMPDAEAWPDVLELSGCRIKLRYRYAPDQEEQDGVTLQVNEQDLAKLPDELMEWTIPAWLPEKVERLIRSLDKPLRLRCNPVKDCAAEAVLWMKENGFLYTHSLYQALAAFLAARLDCILAAPDLNPDSLPGHLFFKLDVRNEQGQSVYRGRSFPGSQQLRAVKQPAAKVSGQPWMQSSLTDWPEIPIPETFTERGRTFWPALADEGESCGVRLFANAGEARQSWVEGLLRLYKLREPDRIRYLQKQFPLSTSLQLELSLLPARGENALEDLVHAVCRQALGLEDTLPRNREEFTARCENAREQLFDRASDISRKLEFILAEKSKVREAMEALPEGPLLRDLEMQQVTLWSPGWCADPLCLERYPRYIKGIQLRMERALPDLEKDARKQERFDPVYSLFSEKAGELSAAQLREAFLKMEEVRLGIFTPEIRAHEKMSPPRFERWLASL